MPAPLIVEFIGMPGSGKTTVAMALSSSLQQVGVDVHYSADGSTPSASFTALPRYRRNLVRVLTIASNPGLAFSVASRSTNRARTAEMWRLVTREVRRQRLQDAPNGLVILDEGPLHKLCTIAAEGDISRPIELLRRLTAPDLSIVLRLDVDLALERIQARQTHSPVDLKPHAELVSYLLRYQEFVDVLIDRLPCPVVSVDSSQEDVTGRLTTSIMKHLNSRV